ncbi:unnamed protein product [Closterium sp. NIES-53]
MASLCVLAFDHEGRPIQFDTWLDDLQLYLLSDSRDSVSLFDHTSGVALASPTTADSATRSQWITRDATAHIAICNHLPLVECAHFRQHRTAQALYDAVVALEDLVSHLRASDARYRAAAPVEFLDRNQPPMFITLYFIVTRLPDSLRSVRDHFLSLDPTILTIDLLEQHLLAGENSVVAVGAAHGTPRTPFFEGCSPSPLAPSYASAAAVDVLGAEDVGAASASVKRCSSKGKGGRGGGGGSGSGGGGSSGGSGDSGGGGSSGSGGGSGDAGGSSEGSDGSGGTGSGGSGGGRTGAPHGGYGGGQRQRQQRRIETPSPQQLREWLFQRGSSWGSVSCPYVIRTGDHAGQTCGNPHTEHRYFFRLDDAWRAEFGDEVERPHWAELLRSGVAIFNLDYDAILYAMYALSASAEGDYYRCSFFRDSTTLTPLPAPVVVSLADPSRNPVIARSSTVLPCLAVPSGSLSGLHLPSFSTNLVSTAALQDSMVTTTTPGGQRVSICTFTQTGRHLATFTRRPWSSLYTMATEPSQVAASAKVFASGPVAPPCSCRLLSHQTLPWHHRLGHPSLPCLRGMHSRLLVSSLPRSLPPLPPSPAPPCLPCVEGWQRAAPHSLFPPTTAPLQTLHMGMWGPARVTRQGGGRYFLLVVDDYTRYTTVFPLRSKGEVVDVLIPWIRAVRLQLRERFRQDLLVLRLHAVRGGEFSSDLLQDFCCGERILYSFTLPASPPQNGIVERRIGLVMEVARTSMIHAAAPHFRWPFEVQYAAHQLNLWPRVSLPETSPTLRWTGQFYHPTSRRVFPSQDIMFDELVPFYCLFPYRSAPPPPPPLFLDPGPLLVDPLLPQGPGPSGAARGTASEGAASGGAEPGGAESEGAGSGGAEPRGAASFGASGAGGTGDTGAGGGGATAGAGGTGGTAATGTGGARTRGTGAAGTSGVGIAGAGDPTEPGAARTGGTGAEAGGAGAVDPGAVVAGAGGAGGTSAGGTVRPRPFFVPLLQESGGLTERREPVSRPVSPIRTARRVPCSRPPPVPGMHAMALRPSSVPLRVPLTPRESSLPVVPDRGSDLVRAARPTVSRLLATVVTDPSFVSAAASALVAEMLDFDAVCRLDYTTALVAESVCQSSVRRGVKWPPGSPPTFKARYVARGFSQRHEVDYFQTFSPTPKMTTLWVLLDVASQRVYELHSLDFSTAFLQGSLHEEIWLRRPPGFTGTTLAALGFARSTADGSLFLRTYTSLPLFYVLIYVKDLVFATLLTLRH